MKRFYTRVLRVLLVTMAATGAAAAQAPPGWGWVNKLGTYVPNTTNANAVAGLGRDAAGNLYLLGTYVGAPLLSGAPTTSQGGSDIFLAKYAPTGALLWLRTVQSSGDDKAQTLVVEPSGRCTMAGYYGGATGGNLAFSDFNSTTMLPGPAVLGLAAPGGHYGSLTFVAAVDANGALLWADTPSPAYEGLNVQSLHRDSSGNCYVSANANPQGTLVVNGQNYPPLGSYDAVLLKYLPAGQVAWTRRVGATGGFTFGGSVKTDGANAVYWSVNHNRSLQIDGRSVSFVAPANPVTQGSNSLVKITATNGVRWIKNSLLKSSAANAQGYVVGIDPITNSVYLTGGSYGGTIADQDNNFPLPVPAGSFGTYVAKCDTSGTVQWLKPFAYASTVPGGANWAAVGIREFFPDATGYTALTATAYVAQTIFPPSTTFTATGSGMPCVVHYSYATSAFDWIRTGGVPISVLGAARYSEATAAVTDNLGNVYVAGNFTGTAQFGATTIVSISSFQPEMFLAKLDQAIVTATLAGGAAQPWSLFPNPSTGAVQLRGLPAAARVCVRDALGRIVRELPALGTTNATPERTLSGLAPGFYLVQVVNTAEPYRSQHLLVQ